MKRTGPQPDAHEQLGASFKAAMAAVRRLKGRETHRSDELSYAQYGLLFGLAAQGARSARELAEAADLSAPTVAQMLESMADTGLVERVRSAEDKRIVLTSLTERGRDLVAERRARIEPRWTEALSEFSDRELRTTAKVLDRLRELFDEFAEAPPSGGSTATASASPTRPSPRRAA